MLGHLPWTADASLLSFSQCQRYDGDLVGAYVSWVAAKKPASYIPVTPENEKYPVRGCDQGWIFNHTFHTLTSENNWVCNFKWKAYTLHTAFWLGASVGVCVCGHIANSCGRRISLIVGMLLCFLGGAATLLASGVLLLFISRFVVGLGHLTTSYLALLLVLEFCDEKYRVFPLFIMMMAHTTATLMSPWIAHVVTSWWWLTLVPTTLSATIFIMLTRVVPESPWWMFIKGDHENAVHLLQSIAKVNRKEPLYLNHKSLMECYNFWVGNHRNMKLCHLQSNCSSRNDLLKSENMHCYSCRKQFRIIKNILWVLCGLCYHGNYYTSLNLVTTALGRRSNPSDIFVSYWYAALMEIPIWILPFILQSHIKIYQVVLTVSLMCAAILSICYAILPTGYIILSLTLGLMTRFAVTVAYYTMVQRRWERINIFDKISTANTESPLVLAVAIVPGIVYMGEYYSQLPSLIFGIIASIAAVTSLFLPEYMVIFKEVYQYDSLQRLRIVLFRKHRRPFTSSAENQSEDAIHVASTVPYNPLESS
ncbi:solute carrier family 22 member 1-like isoform X2 [Zootermopsis nevadensis]|uniref:solute carrier family 22 member 1-like isoform X2 n=1 Tax=Zootermopsis nevadensis TaxID=136037 RepID=UPI000B8EDFD5|nr:solute carrier family 22 member 1-like isoform X2 [Zootermopsis nevadensis]